MPDITTTWSPTGVEGDWTIVPGDLQGGDDLATAVLISLFTDRRAEASDVIPDGSNDRRGWWGDLGSAYPIGSRLWLLSRAKQLPQTLTNAQTYVAEALQWLLDDGVVASISAVCRFIGLGMMGILVALYDQDGTTIAQYQWAWKGLS
jgi:phage gp46-like protein